MSHVSNVSNLFDHISLPLLPFNIAQALPPPFPTVISFSLALSCPVGAISAHVEVELFMEDLK